MGCSCGLPLIDATAWAGGEVSQNFGPQDALEEEISTGQDIRLEFFVFFSSLKFGDQQKYSSKLSCSSLHGVGPIVATIAGHAPKICSLKSRSIVILRYCQFKCIRDNEFILNQEMILSSLL
jgi:hypothetical protein